MSSLPEVRSVYRERRARVLVLAGTRPECIKLVPVVRALEARGTLGFALVNSGQHRDTVVRTLAEFGIGADLSLPGVPCGAPLRQALDHLLREIAALVARHAPEVVLVQGDTLTAYAGARAAHALRVDVAHVEAGLRTASPREPFPEEWYRRRIARYARWHFAPTRTAVDHLRRERIPAHAIHHVGNTGIDTLASLLRELDLHHRRPSASPRLVLVTLHRRENWDRNAEIVCDSLAALATARPDLRIVFPVHPNPRVSAPVRNRLGALPSFALVDPMSYRHFIQQAARASLIISDLGGIQEEAPHVGTPVLVPRTNTERPEGIDTGFVRLVDVRDGAIAEAALEMLAAPRRAPLPIDRDAPFGAGDAAFRIVDTLASSFPASRARA